MRKFFDNALAIFGSVLLHGIILYLLLAGFSWDREPPPPLRTTLKATVVSDEAFRLAEDEIEQTPAPPVDTPPAPEPDPVPEPEQPDNSAALAREAELAEQQREQQERAAEAVRQREAAELLERKTAEEAARKQRAEAEAERQRKAEAEAEARRMAEAEAEAERKRQQAAEAERKRKEAAEAERKRKEAEAERQRQAEEERKRREEEQRKQALEAQLRDALEAEEARAGAIDAGLLAQYVEVIRQKVERNWIRPPGVPDGVSCEVRVRQLRNGEVVSVQVINCAGGEVLIRSIETAVRKASPLPLPRDPSLFEPNLRFPFKTGE